MCGLFGHTCPLPERLDESRRALHTLTHRGPDSWGEFVDSSVYMGHRRLQILDLSDGGHQPMVAGDSGVVLSANGEIYNFAELRAELEGRHVFRGHSDSEVLLHGYVEWGLPALLEKLDGMYAFCLYDPRLGKLFLVRDRVGIKPLYLAKRGRSVAWASELKALVAYFGSATLEHDETALYDFLTYLYVPAPKTAYREVRKLEPAHYAEVDIATGSIRTERYWALEVGDEPIAVEDAAAQLRALIGRTVSDQMMTDVPLGFFLSGGLDSSSVVAEAAARSPGVSTYCIGFDVESHDETRHARKVAEAFATRHHTKVLGAEEATELFGRMPDWYDEPFADTSALPTFLVSRFARESSTVALTGDGGDEVFGGYRWYEQFARRHGQRVSVPGFVMRGVQALANGGPGLLGALAARSEEHLIDDDMELYAAVRSRTLKRAKREYRRRFGIAEDYDDYWVYRTYDRPELPLKTRLQVIDFHTYLPDQLLTKVDRASMAVSLEARVPLLGRDLVDFAFTLPEAVRYHGGGLKGLLKEAYREVLPPEILARGKKGFSAPIEAWQEQLMDPGRNREETILERWLASSAGGTP